MAISMLFNAFIERARYDFDQTLMFALTKLQ